MEELKKRKGVYQQRDIIWGFRWKMGRLWQGALILCGTLFLFSGGMLTRDLINAHQEQETNRLLAEQVQQAREQIKKTHPANTAEATLPSSFAENGVLRAYADLWEDNKNMAGWLSIPGTKLDYPVMFTPEEPEYYLRRNFNKAEAVSGSLFIGEGSTPDATNVIIYGHHMKDGSMFGSLLSYKKAEYWKEHPVIHYDTLTEEGTYEIMAAFYSRVYTDKDEGAFRYYQYIDLSEQEKFDEYLRNVRQNALYDTGVTAEYGDQILTLSTCSYHTKEGRFVVVAKNRKNNSTHNEN